jgi:YfiH family protein
LTPLPPLPPAFRWTTEAWGTALVCDPLLAVAPHVFTTRALTLRVGADAGSSQAEGWDALAQSMGVSESVLLRLRQIHGRQVVTVRRGARGSMSEPPEADAFVSDDPGTALAVRGADCVPLLLADRVTGAVGAVHAGWRGTAAGAAIATVRAMQTTFGSQPSELVAAIGPSIGPCCYRVGQELVDRFAAAGHPGEAIEHWFVRADGLRLDLWTSSRDQLVGVGLREDAVHLSRVCTACNLEQCFSFRREGAPTGRLAGAIRAREHGL